MNNNITNLEKNLKNRIFGQNHVIDELVNTLYISKAGLGDTTKPIASFLFTGSTGVGKTELVKELAKELNMNLERFDMSEYNDKSSARNLIGSAKGLVGHDEGGTLTNIIKNKPQSILLLDEIEKADKSIYDLFLQVFDYGTLMDSKGEKVDFTKSIIVMTSNLEVNKNNKITDFLRPEFINRIDKLLQFQPLTQDMVIHIINKFLEKFSDKLREKNIYLNISSSAKTYLNEIGFNTKMGARSINRAINNEFKTHIAKEILFGTLTNGGEVSIDYKDEAFVYNYTTKQQTSVFPTPFDKDFNPVYYDFETYEEAMTYAKNHPNIRITRASSDYGYIIKR